jgi:hypothetical protein
MIFIGMTIWFKVIFIFLFILQPREISSSKQRSRDIEDVFSHFAHEPTILEVQREALKFAGLLLGEINSWQRRARLAGILPRLNLGLDHDLVREHTLYIQPGRPDRLGIDTDKELEFKIDIEWHLDRLIFDPNELRVSRERNRVIKLRQKILEKVTHLYYERRRLQIEMILEPSLPFKTKVRQYLMIKRLEAEIDALTGGYFSKQLKKPHR